MSLLPHSLSGEGMVTSLMPTFVDSVAPITYLHFSVEGSASQAGRTRRSRPREHQVESQAKALQGFPKTGCVAAFLAPSLASLALVGMVGNGQGSPITLTAALRSWKHLSMSYLIRNSTSVTLISSNLQVRTQVQRGEVTC